MCRSASGANHYALHAWVDVGAGSLGSEVDATGAGVSNHHVRG